MVVIATLPCEGDIFAVCIFSDTGFDVADDRSEGLAWDLIGEE